MIVKEYYMTRKDGVNLYRTFSDAGFTIIREDGQEFEEAVDVENAPFTYTESERKIGDTDTEE